MQVCQGLTGLILETRFIWVESASWRSIPVYDPQPRWQHPLPLLSYRMAPRAKAWRILQASLTGASLTDIVNNSTQACTKPAITRDNGIPCFLRHSYLVVLLAKEEGR